MKNQNTIITVFLVIIIFAVFIISFYSYKSGDVNLIYLNQYKGKEVKSLCQR